MRVKLAAAACVLFAIPCFCLAQAQQTQSAPQTPIAPKPVRVDADVMQRRLIHWEQPVFPAHSKETGVNGTVLLRIIVSKEGEVRDVHVISGPAALTGPCIDAVKKWRYKPTTVKGEAVEVQTDVSFAFSIGNG